ncbi:hypothetical protein CPT_Sansa19 [Caulobacter phage Sansa]|uniref:Uncharacterized protein n=1 Tax=Caulobacter phage Sansa TaxID=1675600 RepID=A0A0K1LML2_9CAUD|nr:hypothetical protein HOR07_gp019 [Caulobacter phage Sansa]AKU43423.1 hypothetical protein CPT_Sansa19 [Caulobacter phage Sansa]
MVAAIHYEAGETAFSVRGTVKRKGDGLPSVIIETKTEGGDWEHWSTTKCIFPQGQDAGFSSVILPLGDGQVRARVEPVGSGKVATFERAPT